MFLTLFSQITTLATVHAWNHMSYILSVGYYVTWGNSDMFSCELHELAQVRLESEHSGPHSHDVEGDVSIPGQNLIQGGLGISRVQD